MKKKILGILISFILLIGLTGCNEKTNNKQNDNDTSQELTLEEKFAADYLAEFCTLITNAPHDLKIYKVWIYQDVLNNYYVAYNIGYQDKDGKKVEGTYGNETGLQDTASETIEAAYKNALVSKLSEDILGYWSDYTPKLKAQAKGELLDSEKIQKAFDAAL